MRRLLRYFVALVMAYSPWAIADGLRSSGSVALETRLFGQSAQFDGQDGADSLSLIVQPEWQYQSGKHKINFVPFYHADNRDKERSHGDVRELYWQWIDNQQDLLIGYNRVFWGVTESRHLVDVINQTDALEDIDGEDKLGQPMIRYTRIHDWGTINLFVLPGFRERAFADRDGRFRPAIPVDESRAEYQSADGNDHIDYAARYSHNLGDWDVGLSFFYGTSREPVFNFDPVNGVLIPYYTLMRQFGVDVQYTQNAWLWKFEGIVRDSQDNRFFAGVIGVEYTLYQIAGSTKDLGLLLEYLYDDRGDTQPATDTDDDIFAGLRLAFNDAEDTSLLFGVLADRNGGDRFYNLEAQTRLSDHLKLEVRLRIFANAQNRSLISAIEKDDYLQVQLQYHY